MKTESPSVRRYRVATPSVRPPPKAFPLRVETLAAVVASTAVGLGTFGLAFVVFDGYEAQILAVGPIAMGASAGVLYNLRQRRELRKTVGVAAVGVLLTLLVAFFYACLATFLPEAMVILFAWTAFALIVAALGAVVGRAVVSAGRPK